MEFGYTAYAAYMKTAGLPDNWAIESPGQKHAWKMTEAAAAVIDTDLVLKNVADYLEELRKLPPGMVSAMIEEPPMLRHIKIDSRRLSGALDHLMPSKPDYPTAAICGPKPTKHRIAQVGDADRIGFEGLASALANLAPEFDPDESAVIVLHPRRVQALANLFTIENGSTTSFTVDLGPDNPLSGVYFMSRMQSSILLAGGEVELIRAADLPPRTYKAGTL